MATTTTTVPILQATNFTSWIFRIKAILARDQVVSVIDMDKPDKESEALKIFLINDAKAKAIIIQGLADKHLDLVQDCATAKEMINSLQNVFVRKSTFSKLTVWRKLVNLKCNRKDSLEDHFLVFDSLCREMEAVGTKIEDEDKTCFLMLSLPPEYNTVITALETVSDLKMDFAKSRLLDHEMKLKGMSKKTDTDNEVVFQAANHSRSGCFICGSESHFKWKCPYRTGQGRQGRGVYRGQRGRGRGRSKPGSSGQSANMSEEISFVALSCQNITGNNVFILDSGASRHLIKAENESSMTEVELLENPVSIKIANGEIMTAKKKGKLRVTCQGKVINIEALLVKEIKHNLLSASTLTSKGFRIIIESDQLLLCKDECMISFFKENGLYVLKASSIKSAEQCMVTSELWHRRLGHTGQENLRKLGLPVSNNKKCSVCIEGKSKLTEFRSQEKRSRYVGEYIHTDLCGPINPPTMNDERYFQVLLDDFSHFVIVKLLKSKDEAADNLIDYIREVERQHGTQVKRIRSDRGGEFSSKQLKRYTKNRGIKIEYTISRNPQMNGKAERMNGTLLNMVRTKLIESRVPKHLWGEALRCSAYELNRVPTSVLDDGLTPSMLYNGRNDMNKMRVFGCRAWSVNLPKGNKLNPRATKGVMVGYCGGGHRIWIPGNQQVIRSRHVTFDEEVIEYASEPLVREYIEKNNEVEENLNSDTEEEDLKQDDSLTDEEEVKQIVKEKDKSDQRVNELKDVEKSTSSGRIVNPPKYLDDYDVHTAYCLLTSGNEPETYEDAVRSEEWAKAIDVELQSLEKLNTWTPSKLPSGKRAIDTKWIFKLKDDGTHKARLVARGFQQKDGDLEFIYSPVCRSSTVRVLFSQAVHNDWNIKQADAPSAFLNGKIEEEIYIKKPKGFECQHEVLRLNRALYGLKCAPKCWNKTFDEFMQKLGMKRSSHDVCLYCGDNVYLLLFVDDVLITGDTKQIEKVMDALRMKFNVKDLGEVSTFLGMNITRDENVLCVRQSKIINKILREFNMENCKRVATPMEVGCVLNGNPVPSETPYRKLICSLMYVALTSRPDIAYSISTLSRQLDNATVPAWKAAKRVVQYLCGTKDYALIFSKQHLKSVKGFSDADWAGDKESRKSVSGFVGFHSGNSVNWFSRKQSCVALSSCESEFISASASVQELMNLKGIAKEFGENVKPSLYVDNQSAISMIKTYQNSKRSKHIDLREHFIKDLYEKGEINVEYVQTNENIADIFTKPLGKEKFVKFRSLLNVRE